MAQAAAAVLGYPELADRIARTPEVADFIGILDGTGKQAHLL